MSTLTIQSIQEQENSLKLAHFNDDVAFKLGIAARQYILEHYVGASAVIDITSVSGTTLFRSYMGQIKPDNEQWIMKKRNTVIRFETASKKFGIALAERGITLADKGLSDQEYTEYGGGFPIRLQAAPDFVFAVITVSGLKDHEDHEICVEAFKALQATLS